VPASYQIDKPHKVVLSSASGVFNLATVLAHQDQLLADPEFDPTYSQLLDFTDITAVEIDTDGVRKIAERKVFWPCPRRAMLISAEMEYSFVRMFQMLREHAGEHGIRVFNTLDDARAWIFLDSSPEPS
jgi:hypothetical protein